MVVVVVVVVCVCVSPNRVPHYSPFNDTILSEKHTLNNTLSIFIFIFISLITIIFGGPYFMSVLCLVFVCLLICFPFMFLQLLWVTHVPMCRSTCMSHE